MERLSKIDPAGASGKAKELLEAVQGKMGRVPNIFAHMAHSPAALQTVLAESDLLAKGKLRGKLREQIAIALAVQTGCEYCLHAHSAIGKMQGASDEELRLAQKAEAPEPKADAVLKFAVEILKTQGGVSDGALATVREAGVSDEEIVEIVANVGHNLFTNFFNRLVQTPVDFPEVERV